jgi:tartrate dehydratase alpha subunit/fumarate hydratase class I-like protein
MAFLTRETLLQKEKLEIVKVALGGDDFVYVRQMTGHERDMWEQSMLKREKDDKGRVSFEQILDNFRAKLAVLTVCDDKGELLFKPEDANTLSRNISAKRLEKIVNVAQELNSISETDKENIIKNSAAVQGDGSSSNSVEN